MQGCLVCTQVRDLYHDRCAIYVLVHLRKKFWYKTSELITQKACKPPNCIYEHTSISGIFLPNIYEHTSISGIFLHFVT